MLMIVIIDYLNDVKKCMELFNKKIGNKHPIKAWRDKTISKSGQLSEDINYDFHGVGCHFEFPNYYVNFDFGKGGESDGFDKWRIASYIDERITYYSYYHEKLYAYVDDMSLTYKIMDLIEEEFQKYIDNGTFFKIGKLFYLSENRQGLKIERDLETFSLKQEIEKILKQNLSELNLERISLNNIEYKLFLEKIVKFILSNNYNELKKLFFDSLIDSQQNIEKYTQNMFDLFFMIKSSDMKYITSQEQKNIFWDYHNQLYKYDSLYVIHAIQMYKENIILFFDAKKSDSVPLALVLNLEGEELFSIPFPTLEDSECVNQNIAFYGGKIDNEKSILEIVFVNGNCWLEFWCRYDLKEKKYIDSGLRK